MAAAQLKVCFVSLQSRGAFAGDAAAKIGGAEMQIRRLALYLAARGDFQVHVIVEDTGQPEREVFDGVTLHRLTQPAERPSRAGRVLRKALSAGHLYLLAKKLEADIYVQRGAGAETGLTAWAARRCRRPFVFMLANDWETQPPWSSRGGTTGRLFRTGLRRAAAVICQHEGQREALRTVFELESEIIPNAYDFPQPTAQPGTGVLWIGRCTEQKHPLRLLELARRLPQIPVHMIAKTTPHEPGLAKQIAHAAAARPNVTFTPGLPPDQTAAAYAAASLLVNTSDFEGMPNTFLEAAGHGLALLALHVDPAGLFTREGAGFCAEGSMDRLADEIARLHADPVAWHELAARGRAILSERHALAKIGPAFAALLQRLAASRL